MKNVVLVFFLINLYISQTITIYGLITDKKSGEAIIGANVFIENTEFGSYSDKNGFYSITIDDYNPKEVIVIQYVGYAKIEKQIILLNNNSNPINNGRVRENFQLETFSLELEVEQITGEQESRQTVNPYSSIKVTQSQLSALPSLAEADIFRTLQSLPGVLQASEFSTGLIIRGGNTDQNLILLDGITVYNPSHLGGVFSNFIVEAIKEANLTKGGFNAEYGGRLSAVLDVISREGNRKKINMKTDISVLSAKSLSTTPVPTLFAFANPAKYTLVEPAAACNNIGIATLDWPNWVPPPNILTPPKSTSVLPAPFSCDLFIVTLKSLAHTPPVL